MAEKQPWKTREDVRKLTIGKTQLGCGSFGKVYTGRIWFRGQKPKRVAVKVFDETGEEHLTQTNLKLESLLQGYQQAIERLRVANIPVAKTGFVKHAGKWVQVQELYGKGGKSKIMDIRRLNTLTIPTTFWQVVKDEKTRNELLDLIAKIINAGYDPHADTIGTFRTQVGHRFIVHDLDNFVIHDIYRTKSPEQIKQRIQSSLEFWIRRLGWVNMTRKETLVELSKRITHRDGIEALAQIQREAQ